MISLNWKMHSVAVSTPCLYMDLDGRKTSHFLFTLLSSVLDSQEPKRNIIFEFLRWLFDIILFSSTLTAPETYFEYNH